MKWNTLAMYNNRTDNGTNTYCQLCLYNGDNHIDPVELVLAASKLINYNNEVAYFLEYKMKIETKHVFSQS